MICYWDKIMKENEGYEESEADTWLIEFDKVIDFEKHCEYKSYYLQECYKRNLGGAAGEEHMSLADWARSRW
jgi:hypothetical protein